MKRSVLGRSSRARLARAAVASLALSTLVTTNAGADDRLGIVLSASPSGAATSTLTMRIPAEASKGSSSFFIRQTTDSTLYGVRLSATPLIDEKGVASAAPTIAPDSHTLPSGGALRRSDLTVSGLETLGTFTSTLYATHGNRTQTLGTLTVVHTRRTNDLLMAPIDSPRAYQRFPTSAARVTLLVTIKNNGETEASFSAPVIAGLASGAKGSQADMPTVRVEQRDGRPAGDRFTVAAGDELTLQLVLDDVKRTGAYRGTLRISAEGHEPVEQSFSFAVKQGPALPVILILLGVAISYAVRRRYSSGRIGRAGQRRLVARLLSDLGSARRVRDLGWREEGILETLERRLDDIADELELARSSKSADALSEIDHKIDLFLSLVVARQHVWTITPESLQSPFESQLGEVAGFLREATPRRDLEPRFSAFSKTIDEMPKAVEAAVRQRFQSDVDRLLAGVETSPTVAAALPIRVLNRVTAGRQLADEGRFGEARAELGAAQLSFARLLAEDLIARIPEPDSAPPGFVNGWPRFRATTVEALKVVRRSRRGDQAAESYRRVWQDYVVELSNRLKSSAARERRKAAGARKEQLARAIQACDDAAAKAIALDPAAVDAYRLAVEGYLAPVGRRPSPTRLRSMLHGAQLPPPLTIVAAGLGDAARVLRGSPSGTQSVASLTRQIRKRHFSLAAIAGIIALPAGLAVLWAPNDTWGDLTDGATIFSWGLGLQALAAMFDSRRLGWRVARDAASVPQRGAETLATVGSPPRMRPEREPAS